MSNRKVVISNRQFMALLVCCTWPTIINYGSGFLARKVGQDMWISGITSVLTTLLFIPIVIYIGRNFPGKTVAEYARGLIWYIPAKLLGLILAAYFLVASSICIGMYIHHLTDFLLPETPFYVVTILHMIVVGYLVWKGPEVIARMGIIGFAMSILFYILVFLASLPEWDLDRLLPLFDNGVLKVSEASLSADTFVGINQIIITMILPLVADQKKAVRSAVKGVAIGGTFFVFYFVVELMVMGSQVVALMRIASMDFVRSIQITQYLHRFESFMVGLWYWSMLVQAGILLYCCIKCFTQTLRINKEKSINIFTAISVVAATVISYFISYNRVFFLNFREFTWQYIAIPVNYGIPLLLLVFLPISKAFRKKG